MFFRYKIRKHVVYFFKFRQNEFFTTNLRNKDGFISIQIARSNQRLTEYPKKFK